MTNFVHLHVHTQYSLLDGAIRLDSLLKRTAEFGMDAVAITDHGTMFGAVEFYEKAKKAGIKPIIGCECYLAPRRLTDKTSEDAKGLSHLVLLAENQEGYRNLCSLASIAQLKGFYYKPRIDKELLRQHNKGLIGLSACLHGEIPRLIQAGKTEQADEAARFYLEVFGENNFFLEIQNNGLDIQETVNQALLDMSQRLSVPLVATNDCHYLDKEDVRAHEVLLCIQTGKTINDPERFKFGTDQLYFKPKEVMHADFKDYPGALETTGEIAKRCEIEFDFKTYHFPQFEGDSGLTADDIFDQKVREGYAKRLREIKTKRPDIDEKAYAERLEYEMFIIKEMGFPGYFLIVADFIQYAKENNVPVGPGRGCLCPGSKVMLASGKQVRIQDVEAGDRVLTHLGNILPVQDKMVYDCDEEIVHIHAGNDVLSLTQDHKVWALPSKRCAGSSHAKSVKREPADSRHCSEKPFENAQLRWIKAGDLKKGDFVVFPKIASKNKDIGFDLAERVGQSDDVHADDQYVYLEIRHVETSAYKGKVYDITVPPDASYVANSMAVHNSAAGSIVAYSLGITDLDPIEHGLIFERFLNPARISMPDIDVDFCINGREKVFKYVVERYGGGEYVAQIITFGTLKSRAVIRDVGRALDIPLREVDMIAKLVPDVLNISLDDALKQEPRLRQLAHETPQIGELIKISRVLEGLTRHASTHAAGVVIGDKPLVEYLPLYKGKKDEVVTQFDMKYVEKIGLVKFDFLGLRNLTVIENALSLIRKQHGSAPDLLNLDFNDEKTYQLLSSGDTTGVFQLESSGMKDLLMRLKPACFDDVIALVALYRPGPLDSGMVDDFVERKHGRKKVEYLLPELEPILKETYGVIVYQEQVMKIAGDLAKYSMAEADGLRKAMGKKIPEIMAEHRDRFAKGTKENELPSDRSAQLFDLMEKFGGYGFNKTLDENTQIHTANGIKTIADCQAGDQVITIEKDGTHTYAEIVQVHDHGQVPVWEVTFDDGTIERSTLDHKWLTQYGQLPLWAIIQMDGQVWGTPSFKTGKATQKECQSYTLAVPDHGQSTTLALLSQPDHGQSTTLALLSQPDHGQSTTLALPFGYSQEENEASWACGPFDPEQQRILSQDILTLNPCVDEAFQKKLWRTYFNQPRPVIQDDTRRQNPGRDTVLRKPVRAMFLGWRQGYDLEINHPEHNFVLASGICCSNSHSAAYALIAFQTAYLKAHYPVEFMASLLTSEMHSSDGVVKYISECKSHGIRVRAPDINDSDKEFSASGSEIRFGLVAVKNVGEGAIESIIEEREKNGNFSSLFDFCERVDLRKVNKRVIESLIKCGAFDSTAAHRSQMAAALEHALDYGQRIQKERSGPQLSLFGTGDDTDQAINAPTLPEITEWDDKKRLTLEKEALGFYITGHPLSRFESLLNKFSDVDSLTLRDKADGQAVRIGGIITAVKTIRTKKGDPMAFVTTEDMHGSVETTVFPSIYASVRDLLASDTPILIEGQIQKDENSAKILADKMIPMDKAQETYSEHILFTLDITQIDKALLEQLRDILKTHPGSCRGSIYLVDPEKTRVRIDLHPNMGMKAGSELTHEVNALFDTEVVEIVAKAAKVNPHDDRKGRRKYARS